MRGAGTGSALGSCFSGGCLSAIVDVLCGVASFFPGATVSSGHTFLALWAASVSSVVSVHREGRRWSLAV